jgi:hypothetical protein
MKRAPAVAAILWSVALSTAFALAAEADGARSRVALVRSASTDRVLHEATTRVRAELLDAGFEVVDVDSAPGDARSEVEGAAPDGACFATIAMNHAAGGAFADVWISDHLTGKTVVRRVGVRTDTNAPSVLAIRTLELLRASLLEAAARVQPNEPPMTPARDVMQWIAPALPDASPSKVPALRGTVVGFGALTLDGLQGIGLAVGPTIAVSRGFGPWFARIALAGPLLGPDLQTTTGSATVRQEMGALEFGWASVPAPIGVDVWGGAGGYDLHTDGSASAPYRALGGDVASFVTTAGVGALAQLSPRVLLALDLSAVVLTPQPIVVIAGRDVGSAGLPSIGASLGLLVGL